VRACGPEKKPDNYQIISVGVESVCLTDGGGFGAIPMMEGIVKKEKVNELVSTKNNSLLG